MSTLRTNISRYLAYKRDNNELLLFILRGLANETATYMRNRCLFPSLCHPNIIPSFVPRIEEQSSLIDFYQYSNLHVQVWNRPGSHRGAREGSYGEGALGPMQSVFILSASSLMPCVRSIYDRIFPGKADLHPEPAALLRVRDVQGQQFQLRLWAKTYHPAVLSCHLALNHLKHIFAFFIFCGFLRQPH